MGFYCDNCGEQVEINSKICSHCGVRFQAVKCPRCDFTGAAGLFKEGCPSCGYLGKTSEGKKTPSLEKDKGRYKNKLSDRTFWILGILLLLSIPVLLMILFHS